MAVGRHRAYDQDAEFITKWQWADPALSNVTDILMAAVRGRSGRVLDVGCGTGRAAVALAQAGFEVQAIDVDARIIDIACQVSKQLGVAVNYRIADFSEPKVVDRARPHDVVVCIEVLEHIVNWRDAMANLRDAVRPGGLLFLTVPHDPAQYNIIDEYAGHVRRFRPGEILGELTGFSAQFFTVGFPCFRTITCFYDRGLRVLRKKHTPETLWRGGKGHRLFLARVLYALAKLDNTFNGLCLGTTLVVRATKNA